eukprot:TRINITY_DN46652_c0_g1_i1.p1 TRINITY_DN46652_c0_g1~~TRINITY_DN46652_c0_g1_i1.p1  ORF type:complete len:306 (-),score=20.59 TRINITY_DN46652_c0_g1_i1:180-1097(-)
MSSMQLRQRKGGEQNTKNYNTLSVATEEDTNPSSRTNNASSSASSPLIAKESKTGTCTPMQSWLDSIFLRICSLLPISGPELTNEELCVLSPFGEHASRSFDHDTPEHALALKELWAVWNPSNPDIDEVVREEWTNYGFQNSDPASDFRAAGILGLHNLLFFANTFPDQFHAFSKERPTGYPFAIAGLNVTMTLLAMLHITDQKTCFSTTQDDKGYIAKKARKMLVGLLLQGVGGHDQVTDVRTMERNFHYVYCSGFALLDKNWTAMKAGPMQFNEVLKVTRKNLEEVITRCKTIDQLTTMVGLQ